MDEQLVQMDIERKIAQLPLYDRYIVKLKMSEAAVFSNETPMESIGANIDAAIPAAKSTANAQVRAVLSEKQVEETALFDLTTTPTYTVEEQSPALLTVSLSQKVDAAAFTAELANNAQIEYIQPDYALELASDVVLNLDLSELEPAETAAPAATGALEIDMEITPEQTPAAGVATVPETELEPAVTPTPTLPSSPATAPVVAVIDAGVDVAHHGLVGQMLPGYDFVNNTELVYDSSKKGEYYHGTHVAGIIAQNAPAAQILPLKVFEHGRAYTSDIIRAVAYAEENGASVVNMSFGGTDDNRALREAMAASGMLFVCAAGNARTNVEEAPMMLAENIKSVATAQFVSSYVPVVGVMEIETGSMLVLQVPIDVDKIGTYAVWMRSRVNTDAQDSIWMNVDGGTYLQRILEISSYDEQAQYNMYG